MAPKLLTQSDQDDRVRVGATLRTLRNMRGWELGDFATKIGISYSYLSNIEAGRKPLTDKLLARTAQVLEVEQIAIRQPNLDSPSAAAS
jgi:transcriptional regulator with XRE-family HTH domain